MDKALNPKASALRDAVRLLLVAHGTLDDAKRSCGTPLATSHAKKVVECGRSTLREFG